MEGIITSDELKAMIDEFCSDSKTGETALERNLLAIAKQLLDLQAAAEDAWYAAPMDMDEMVENVEAKDSLVVASDREELTPRLVLGASREITEAMAAEWNGEVAGHC